MRKVLMRSLKDVNVIASIWPAETSRTSPAILAIQVVCGEPVAAARAELTTRIGILDDKVAGLYLANQADPAMILKTAIRRATIGSAYQFRAVQPLLDAVVDYLSSPADVRACTAIVEGGESAIEVNSAASATHDGLAIDGREDSYNPAGAVIGVMVRAPLSFIKL